MTKAQKDRNNRLLPNGIPRWIRCYDNGEETADRYTVVYTGRYGDEYDRNLYVVMNNNPFHPCQGICQHRHGNNKQIDWFPNAWPPAIGRKCHLGTRIKFEDLPEDCGEIVFSDYLHLWNIPVNWYNFLIEFHPDILSKRG